MSQVQDIEKRSRSGNFSKAETKLLLQLANSNKSVVENKRTDSRTNKLKACTWDQIEKDFNRLIQGPSRSMKVLKAKYETVKRELRKRSLDWKQTGGDPSKNWPSPLTEEEKELWDTIILSCEDQVSLPQDLDYNPEVPKGFETHQTHIVEDNLEHFINNEETNEGATYCPVMLCHPLLSSTSEVSAPPTSITTPATSTTASSAKHYCRRRPGLKWKRYRVKFDELMEKKLKTEDLKYEKANLDRETAKINLAIAQVKLKIVMLEHECQKRDT